MSNLSFLNDYWILCESTKKSVGATVAANQHFTKLNKFLMQNVGSSGEAEDTVTTKYRGKKRWDLHFVDKKVLIEYKSASDTRGVSHSHATNLHKSLSHRIEAAIGCAVDVKHFDPCYKLGFVMVFFVREKHNMIKHKKFINNGIVPFYKMIDAGLYDFFCPLISFGKDDHEELSTVYTMNKFLSEIRNTESQFETPLSLLLETPK